MESVNAQSRYTARTLIVQEHHKILELQHEVVLMNKMSKTFRIEYGIDYNYRSEMSKIEVK